MASRWTRRWLLVIGLLLAVFGTAVSLLYTAGWWLQDERSIWTLLFGLSFLGVLLVVPGWLLIRWTRRGERDQKASDVVAPVRDRRWLAAVGLVLVGAAGLVVWGANRASKDGMAHVEGTVVDTYVHCPSASDIPLCDHESTIEVVVDGDVIRFGSNHGISTTAVGDPVDVWYDPTSPGEDTFVTNEDLRGVLVGPSLMAVFAVFVGVPFLLFGWWRSRTSVRT